MHIVFKAHQLLTAYFHPNERSSYRQCSPITIHSTCHIAGTITSKYKESTGFKRAVLSCFRDDMNQSTDFEGGGNDARPSPRKPLDDASAQICGEKGMFYERRR